MPDQKTELVLSGKEMAQLLGAPFLRLAKKVILRVSEGHLPTVLEAARHATPDDGLLDSTQAAKYLGFSRSNLYRLVKLGQLIPIQTIPGRRGCKLRFERGQLDELKRGHTVKPHAPPPPKKKRKRHGQTRLLGQLERGWDNF